MRYIVDISQQQAEAVQRLIQTGKYPTVAQFILAAVENQIHIENNGAYESAPTKSSHQTIEQNKSVVSTDLRARLTLVKDKPQTVSPPKFTDLVVSSSDIPEDKSWLWGQTNKILPVKVGLRALYSYIGSAQWADLEEFRDMAAGTAAEIGSVIKRYEDAKKKKRDDRISAGFPDIKEFKSKQRYKSHFLGYMRKDGLLEGPMPFLRLINLKRDDKGMVSVGLTKAGLQFAQLSNPAIDQQIFETSFSEKEIDFYLSHILENVSGESSAIKWLLRKIKEGVVERTSLNVEIKKEFSHTWKDASDAVINTQRAGLMARMFELGLIEKKKTGVRVSYAISNRGKAFLTK